MRILVHRLCNISYTDLNKTYFILQYNKSMFSYLYVRWQRGTARIHRRTPMLQQSIDIFYMLKMLKNLN